MDRPRKKKNRKAAMSREQRNPLTYAVSSRDSSTLDMVRDAIRHKQVMLAFQPVVQSGKTKHAAYFEGLLRVLDETGRIIPAKDFIDAIEDSELGRQLDGLALELGLETLAAQPNLRLSINMSARSIGYAPWMQTLQKGLARGATVPERLILEISEKSVTQVPDIVRGFMEDLQIKGISFGLDDYGSGLSSLRIFRDFDFDIVKLDGGFSHNIANDSANQVLAGAVAAIAERFDMISVASRIESPADAQTMQELGFDCLQGFAFGAPTVSPPWTRKNRHSSAA
ncbi:EAL domain-containing protein [Shimia haliotis]|uniref:EAL domain, c-di-GMP-specific phosphodiesterase class I (Or its enzymatically inactive variant) n=1 Tax=Shimia haliotis TaxID=1280847 RepID=A0A1I4CRT9_9RHOB|nr:EAL domain-containing protein [Shimia haliotis]SFK83978.1 EAL domain, c-di-GMP-specific phosphodiesterase class I (or its enzymatically inactive variant) [Shimia haliotis]